MTSFTKKVYEITSRIPKGEVLTYKQVASLAGRPGASRAVGNALNKNPFIPRVPCHRVVRSDMTLGGYAKGLRAKAELLKKEGLTIRSGRIIIKK